MFGKARMRQGRRTLALALVIGTTAAAAPAQPLILACPGAPDALCAALRDRLEATAGTPARIVTDPSARPSARPSTRPARGLYIELRLTRFDRVALEGRLDWQRPKDPTEDPGLVSGPLVTFSVDDAPLTPAMYPAFAAGLIKSTPLPL